MNPFQVIYHQLSHFDKSFKQLSLIYVSPLHLQLNVKTVLFQTIQLNISTQFSSIWPMDSTLLAATTLGQNGPGSHGNEGILHIPQSSSITEASPLNCLVSYPGHSLGGVLTLCRDAVSVFCSPSWLGQWTVYACVCVCIYIYIYIYIYPMHKLFSGHLSPN